MNHDMHKEIEELRKVISMLQDKIKHIEEHIARCKKHEKEHKEGVPGSEKHKHQ